MFVSGCTFNCVGCFNKEQQDFEYGDKWTKQVEDKFIEYVKDEKVSAISILGGEPFQQEYSAIKNLLIRIKKEVNKPVWVWTGYTFPQLLMSPYSKELLNYIDVLIDGRFEIDKRNINLKYRGSENQKVINIKESLINKKIIEL